MSGIEYLLDTNMVIGLLKNHAPAAALAENVGLTLDKAGVSQISRMELLGYPGLTDAEERAIRAFLSMCRIIPLDERIEAEAIRLRRNGKFKLPDAIIAASAVINQARLLTLDQRMAREVAALQGQVD